MNRKNKIIQYVMAAMVFMFTAQLTMYLAKPLSKVFSNPNIVSFLVYLQTGRSVTLKTPPQVTQPPAPQETAPETTTEPQRQEQQPLFEAEDTQLIQVSNFCNYFVDTQSLLQRPLSLELRKDAPTVLILHSHATESYAQTPADPYTASSAYRTLDDRHNMLRIGEEIAKVLEDNGIHVLHDKTLHDYPSYNDSYILSRKTAQNYLEQNPSIQLVLDIHRDASDLSNGGQLQTQAWVNGESASQLMMVVGSNAGGRTHPNWEENLALAMKLHVTLEKRWPGLCRPISFRTERFNQDLLEGALLVEVGAAGDYLEEAIRAAQALAEGIVALSGSSVTADSTN